jgi:hypothetical protein
LAVLKRGRYYYWKNSGGVTIYLGSEDKPKRAPIHDAIEKLEKRKARLERDLQTLRSLLKEAS